jgi:hypothetical protein
MRAHFSRGSKNFPSKLLLKEDGKVSYYENKTEIYDDLNEKVTSIEDFIFKVYPDVFQVENRDH